MNTKALTGTGAAAVIVVAAGLIIGIAFWRSADPVVMAGTTVGIVGWLAWWYGRVTANAQEPGESAIEDPARQRSAQSGGGGNAANRAPERVSDPAEPRQGQAGETQVASRMAARDAALAGEVRLALTESDEAITSAITVFNRLAGAAQDISECTREMKSWHTAADPLVQTTLDHVAECSQTISEHVELIRETFQFQDVLRERLEHTASALDAAA